jgi:glycosyltransferase involved in cell wall biosynthesis
MKSPSSSHRVSFVFPALNEAGNIEAAVHSVQQALANKPLAAYELILVNDGSTDETGAIMDRLAQHSDHIRVVHNPRNLGYGGAFKRGAAAARLDYVIRICGDNSVPVHAIELILEQLGRADLVIPYIANPELRSWGRRIASRGFTIIINFLFRQRVRYYNHAVAFPRHLLESIQIVTDGFAYQAEALVKLLKAGCTYVEVGVVDLPRVHGKSTALRPRNLWRVLTAIVRLMQEIHRPGAIPTLTPRPPIPDPVRQPI